METKNSIMIERVGGRGNGELLFKRGGVPVWEKEKTSRVGWW